MGRRRALSLAAILMAATVGCAGFGRRPSRADRSRFEHSAQYEGRKFHNPEPMYIDFWGAMRGGSKDAVPVPEESVSVLNRTEREPERSTTSGLRATWLGHSSVLVEIDGRTLLTDPHWGPRASPFRHAGPKRWYEPPLPLDDLPPVDAVLISHDHYDHLDHTTIQQIAGWDTRFVVPLGVGAHLQRWGVPEDHITELDWWGEAEVGELRVVCVPARHASGRRMVTRDRTLWAGYAIVGTDHRAYFSGDTGLFPALEAIGDRYGPFDLTMIEVGQYDASWPDWHLGPENAVLAHVMVQGETLLPIHWGLFRLAPHSWTEPIERVLVRARAAGVPVATPRPGETVNLDDLGPPHQWWPDVPWQTEDDAPISTTVSGDPDERVDTSALWKRFGAGR